MSNTETLIPTRITTVHNLSENSPDDYIWNFHKGNADQVASILTQPPEVWIRKQARRIWSCAGWLIFSVDAKTLALKLERASFCHVRFCPVCQWRRSLRWKAKMYQILPELNKKMEVQFPKARWMFFTLTTRNVPISDLHDQLKAMNKAWGRLVKRRAFRHVIGWVRSVEVTRHELHRTAHPHFHCLMLVKSTYFKGSEYLTTDKWSKLWGDVMRLDYPPIVDIRVIKDRGGTGMNRAIAETLKYAVKEFDMVNDPAWFTELVRQTHKTRAVASGGVLKDLFREGEEDYRLAKIRGDMGNVDPKTGQVRFNWARACRRYQRRTIDLVLQKIP